MRFFLVSFCLLLVACAAPQAGQYYFNGIYVPGNTAIGEDGKFVARASVWEAAQITVAQQAALTRLQKSAAERGYAFFIPDDAKISDGSGNQFVMTGRLFRDGAAPGNAMPIDMLVMAQPVPAEELPVIAAQKVAPKPSIPAARAQGTEPLVIAAPEFVTE